MRIPSPPPPPVFMENGQLLTSANILALPLPETIAPALIVHNPVESLRALDVSTVFPTVLGNVYSSQDEPVLSYVPCFEGTVTIPWFPPFAPIRSLMGPATNMRRHRAACSAAFKGDCRITKSYMRISKCPKMATKTQWYKVRYASSEKVYPIGYSSGDMWRPPVLISMNSENNKFSILITGGLGGLTKYRELTIFFANESGNNVFRYGPFSYQASQSVTQSRVRKPYSMKPGLLPTAKFIKTPLMDFDKKLYFGRHAYDCVTKVLSKQNKSDDDEVEEWNDIEGIVIYATKEDAEKAVADIPMKDLELSDQSDTEVDCDLIEGGELSSDCDVIGI